MPFIRKRGNGLPGSRNLSAGRDIDQIHIIIIVGKPEY
jgi:hypothetical protein